MARRAKTYRIYERGGLAWIDIRSVEGLPRIREALGVAYCDERTGRSPSRAAENAAARRYKEVVRGRSFASPDRVLTIATDEELIAVWLDAIETPTNKKSVDTKGTYGRTWHRFFADEKRWEGDRRVAIERMVDDAGVLDYALHRLTKVLRKTVRKELTALFEFFEWAKIHRHIAFVPERPRLPKSDPGVRAGKQRSKPVDIEPTEARAILAALPEYSDASRSIRKGYADRAFPVRAPLEFMWEMTWRPTTIARLEVPRNWSPGRDSVDLDDADDKARYGREVTLTKRAKEILERWAPKRGVIFGEHDYRAYVKAAALKVLPQHKAVQFARYDFRHGRINHLLDVTNDLLGTAQIAGHKQITTTNAYLRSKKRQGDAVIDAITRADAAPAPASEGDTMRAHALETDRKAQSFQSGRGDSNPRPLDPQRKRIAKRLGNSADEAPSERAKNRQETESPEQVRAQCGHILEAARTLATHRLVWDAFDAFTDFAEDES